ncbi:MAG: hypothetical protein K2X93_19995 [Candidatus Obscuribacterales bacterium]|nr:hypothetical protein [Candidatus Obscuribacterales bacterium]
MFIQTADALAHAHEKGVIHRDITPGNIMIITGLDNPPIVKGLDFGVAKLVSKEEQIGFLTDPGTILGSPHDASLKKYTKTSDELFTLPLANSKVTDDGLKYLTTQKSLRTLDLSSTQVHSLKYVKGISNLEDLDLMNCKLDSGALENLQNLSSLKLVVLDSTNVTAQDVALLAKNHAVNKVSVKSCPKIGPKELDFLQKEMPLCLVQPKELTLAEEIAIYSAQENFEKCYSLAKAQVASMNKYDSPHIMKGLTLAATSCSFVGKFDESLQYIERQKLFAKKTGTTLDRLLANDSEIQHLAHANELERLIKVVDEDKEIRSKYRSDSNEVIARNYDMIATAYMTKINLGERLNTSNKPIF